MHQTPEIPQKQNHNNSRCITRTCHITYNKHVLYVLKNTRFLLIIKQTNGYKSNPKVFNYNRLLSLLFGNIVPRANRIRGTCLL